MHKLLKQIFPVEFFVSPVYFRAIVLAVVYLVVLLAELFHFEKFPGIVGGFDLPGGHIVTVATAVLLPLLLAISLPYLIAMRLSKWSYEMSRAATIAAPLVWIILGVYINVKTPLADNAGLFGGTLILPIGWWLVAFALLWLWSAVLVIRELPRRKK